MKVRVIVAFVCVVLLVNCGTWSDASAKPIEIVENYVSLFHVDILGRLNYTDAEEASTTENINTGSFITAPSIARASCPEGQTMTRNRCRKPYR